MIDRAVKKVGRRATGVLLGFVDTSFLGNGNDGLLFTTDGIAFDYAFQKVFLRYDEIERMEFSKKETELIFIGNFAGVKNNSTTVPLISDIYFDIHKLKELIEEIKRKIGC